MIMIRSAYDNGFLFTNLMLKTTCFVKDRGRWMCKGESVAPRGNLSEGGRINPRLNIARNRPTRRKQNQINGGDVMKVLRYVCAVSMILALFFFSTTCVYAQEHQQRERWQQLNNQVHDAQAKINAGTRDGSLTRPEAERLRNELKRIESDMNRAGRDGISRPEMDRLEREFGKLRKDIYREETNRERRPEKRY